MIFVYLVQRAAAGKLFHTIRWCGGIHMIRLAGVGLWVSVLFVHASSYPIAAASTPHLVVDPVEIVQFYPSQAGTMSWHSSHWENGIARTIPRRDPDDPTGWSQKRGIGELEVDGQGILTMRGHQPRLYLNGVPDKFWKNVEVTAYYRRLQDDAVPYAGLVVGVRSGPDGHTSRLPCTATTYYARLRHDGKMDFAKELKHPGVTVREQRHIWHGEILPHHQWIGLKFVAQNQANDSRVKLELYRDLTEGAHGGHWDKLGEYLDDGTWVHEHDCPDKASDHVITVGGGVVFLRNTAVQEAHYKWVTVREIVPSSTPLESWQIDDFEDTSDWTGLDWETHTVHSGVGAGRWDHHLSDSSAQKTFSVPIDASGADEVRFWAYSEVANGTGVELIFDSDNDDDPTGWDYYHHEILVNWSGWRYIRIALADFEVARRPVGWHEINYVRFAAKGWGHESRPDTVLIFDEMSFQAASGLQP